MTEPTNPFDLGQDPVLGAGLRQALEPGGEAAFVARVLAAYDARGAAPWDVLATWARRGIAVAAVAALVGFLLGGFGPEPVSSDEAFAASLGVSDVPETTLLTSQRPPDAAAVLASVVER